MIAADTSSLIDFLKGLRTAGVDEIRRALNSRVLWLPPPVKTELLSAPMAPPALSHLLDGARLLPIRHGFWDRAGTTRRLLMSKGLKAKLADTLIAQCCIDADVELIAADGDYLHFAHWCGLRLKPDAFSRNRWKR